MRYWDSSAVVPLLVAEEASAAAAGWLREDGEIVTWWGTALECASALCRREREGLLGAEALTEALDRLGFLQARWTEVEPTEKVRDVAKRLLRVHPLRTADALQLAAALIACEGEPAALGFMAFDERLRMAADREGLAVCPERL